MPTVGMNSNSSGFSIMSSDTDQNTAQASGVVERKGPKSSQKKNSSGSERAPFGRIDPNAHGKSGVGISLSKNSAESKSSVKKQRFTVRQSSSSPPSPPLSKRASAQGLKLSSSEDEEIEIDSLKGSATFLTHAKPVIDPNDSMEYESELKMLEEFYQTKSHELASQCPLHGQPFIEEERWEVKEEEEQEEYSVALEEEKDDFELNNAHVLYSSEALCHPTNERCVTEETQRGSHSEKET